MTNKTDHNGDAWLHLRECPHCPKLIENMKRKGQGAGQLRPGASPASRTVNVGPPSNRLVFARHSD